MSTPWIIAVVSLWVLLAIVAVGVVALARQVGLLHLRLRPVGAGALEAGPPVGSVPTLPDVTTLRGQGAQLLIADRIGLVLFVSPSCGLCKPVLAGAARLGEVEPDIALTVAVDDGEQSGDGGLAYLGKHGFNDGISAAQLSSLDSGSRPYAVAVSPQGMVLASGAVNTLYQLEALVDLATAYEAGADDDDRGNEPVLTAPVNGETALAVHQMASVPSTNMED